MPTDTGTGRMFMSLTRYQRDRARGARGAGRPRSTGGGDAATGRVVELPAVTDRPEALPLWECFAERASVREFDGSALPLATLSHLLWACAGLNGRGADGFEFRTYPSAGALYPIETHVVANNVSDLEQGSYRYDYDRHVLVESRRGELGPETARACLDQRMADDASAVFVFTAVPERNTVKYRDRGYRYICMEAGIMSENLALAAHALRLGSCAIGAFIDADLEAVVGVDGRSEVALLAVCVGKAE